MASSEAGAAVNATAAGVVRVAIVVPGDVPSFDQEAYKASLARTLSVEATSITLNASAASVRVVASIRSEDPDLVAARFHAIANVSEALGVMVEEVVGVEVIESAASSSPLGALAAVGPQSLSTETSTPASGSADNHVVLAVALACLAASVLAVVLAAAIVVWTCRRMGNKVSLRRTRSGHDPHSPKSPRTPRSPRSPRYPIPPRIPSLTYSRSPRSVRREPRGSGVILSLAGAGLPSPPPIEESPDYLAEPEMQRTLSELSQDSAVVGLTNVAIMRV